MRTLHSGKLKNWQLLLLAAFVLVFFSACAGTSPKVLNKSKQRIEKAVSYDNEKNPESSLLKKATSFFKPAPKAPPLLSYQKDLKVAQYRYNLQEYPEAEFYLKKTLLQFPDEPSALKLLPWTYFYQKRYDKALLAFERNHTANPRDPRTLAGMGWCYLSMNNYQQALDTFARAEKFSPAGLYDINKGRAVIYLKQKNPEKALASLKEIYNPREIEKILAFWQSEGDKLSKSSYPILPDNSGSPSLFTLPVDGPRYLSMLWGIDDSATIGRGIRHQSDAGPNWQHLSLLTKVLRGSRAERTAAPHLLPALRGAELETAWKYYRQGLYRRALTAFQNLPATLSQTLDAQNGLAWSYLKNRKIQKADPVFNQVAQTYPKFIGLVKGLQESENLKMQKAAFAQYYFDLNKFRIAEKKFEALKNEFPNWAYSYVQLGRIALKNNDHETAQKLFLRATELDPKNKAGLAGMEALVKTREPDLYEANQALKQEKYRKAARLYHEYIEYQKPSTELNKSLARAYNGLGWSQFHKGQFQLAVEKFKQSRKHEEFASDSLRGIGLSYFHLKRYKDAANFLKFVRDNHPDEKQGSYELDWSILRSWGDIRARQYFEREMRVDPLRASLYMGMGWIHYKNGKPDLAVEYFLKAISLDPDSVVSDEFFNLLASQRFGWQVYNRLGWAYYHERKFTRSLEMFQTSLKERPDRADSHKGIGYNFSQMKKYAPAIKYLQQSLVLNPASTPVMETVLDSESKDSIDIKTTARTKLARVYYHSGNYLKAIQYYKKDLTYHPRHTDAYAGLGWAYLKLRRLTESRAAFTESLKQEPLNTRSHKGLKEVKQLLATRNIRVNKPAFSKISMTSPTQKVSPN